MFFKEDLSIIFVNIYNNKNWAKFILNIRLCKILVIIYKGKAKKNSYQPIEFGAKNFLISCSPVFPQIYKIPQEEKV